MCSVHQDVIGFFGAWISWFAEPSSSSRLFAIMVARQNLGGSWCNRSQGFCLVWNAYVCVCAAEEMSVSVRQSGADSGGKARATTCNWGDWPPSGHWPPSQVRPATLCPSNSTSQKSAIICTFYFSTSPNSLVRIVSLVQMSIFLLKFVDFHVAFLGALHLKSNISWQRKVVLTPF